MVPSNPVVYFFREGRVVPEGGIELLRREPVHFIVKYGPVVTPFVSGRPLWRSLLVGADAAVFEAVGAHLVVEFAGVVGH